jgi:ribosomal protein L12E/L44/L45/RPP1/RPP2
MAVEQGGDAGGAGVRAADAADVLASFGDYLPEEGWLPALAHALLGFPDVCDRYGLPLGAAAAAAHEALCHDGSDANGSGQADEEEEEEEEEGWDW